MDVKRLNNILGVNNDEDEYYEMEDLLTENENELDVIDFETKENRISENEINSSDTVDDDFFELDEIAEDDW